MRIGWHTQKLGEARKLGQKLKELSVAKKDGVFPKDDKPNNPVTEVGGETDKHTIYNPAAASVCEFSEVKSTAEDLRVSLRSKASLTKMCLIHPSLRCVWGEIRALTAQLQPE